MSVAALLHTLQAIWDWANSRRLELRALLPSMLSVSLGTRPGLGPLPRAPYTHARFSLTCRPTHAGTPPDPYAPQSAAKDQKAEPKTEGGGEESDLQAVKGAQAADGANVHTNDARNPAVEGSGTSSTASESSEKKGFRSKLKNKLHL